MVVALLGQDHHDRDHSHGRCAAILEGGYDLLAIRNSVGRVLAEFQRDNAPLPTASGSSRGGILIERIKKTQRRYWRL